MFRLAYGIGRSFILILVVLVPVITASPGLAHIDHAASVDSDRHVTSGPGHASGGIGEKTTGTQDNFTYPFKTVFEKDILDIAQHTVQIQEIVVEKNMAFIWAVVIRIDYTSGLSDSQKIELQASVQRELQSKWYVNHVENNGILCIPEECHIPWPGFVIGELIVGFLPVIVSASIITATSVHLSWTLTTDIGARQYIIYLNQNNISLNSTLVKLPGTVSSYDVTGLSPGTTYRFQVSMFDVNGDYGDGRILVVSTILGS